MSGDGADSRLPAGADAAPEADGFRALAGWMQEIAPFGIFTTDVNLRVRSWNNWMIVHSGLTADQAIGREIAALYPDITDRRAIDRFTRALAGEISVMSAALHKHLLPLPSTVPDSALEHMLQTARIAPLRDHGSVIGTITIIEDVTQREVQANILRRQQELDRLLSASLATLLQTDDPAQEIGTIFANMSPALGLDAYVCYLLAADAKTLQLKLAGGFSPRQRETIATLSLLAEDERTLLGGASGSAVNLSSHANVLRSLGLRGQCSFPLSVGNRLLGLVSFGSYQRDAIAPADVNVLSRIARYVTIALDRAIRERETLAASRAKDDFLAALSHELRTPLNPVLLLASDGAVNLEFSAAARESFRVIEKNALLEARLIDDLLDLTRIEHGKMRLERQRFDMNSVLKDALATVASDAAERDLSIHVDLQTEATTLVGDSGRLQQVFWNVLKNAVKFTPVGGNVSVSTHRQAEDGEVLIQISDTGIGMEPHELLRVFNAFSQGDHADHGHGHRFGGLGLGLAITRKLVELHSGRIEATSQGKNQGSTF
ncbi:MAG TPA: ATP-binding protein, partial [Opitutus sp.]|nr:ATP-binding protein [Opitutus sp.]